MESLPNRRPDAFLSVAPQLDAMPLLMIGGAEGNRPWWVRCYSLQSRWEEPSALKSAKSCQSRVRCCSRRGRSGLILVGGPKSEKSGSGLTAWRVCGGLRHQQLEPARAPLCWSRSPESRGGRLLARAAATGTPFFGGFGRSGAGGGRGGGEGRPGDGGGGDGEARREGSGAADVEEESRPPTNLRSLFLLLQRRLQKRASELRDKPFLKLFVLLLGYFLANALSTVVGQTGDWDVLVAGFLVALIESVNFAVYRWLPRSPIGKRMPESVREFFNFMNIFKAGLMFGLFVDCFKVGS